MVKDAGAPRVLIRSDTRPRHARVGVIEPNPEKWGAVFVQPFRARWYGLGPDALVWTEHSDILAGPHASLDVYSHYPDIVPTSTNARGAWSAAVLLILVIGISVIDAAEGIECVL